MDSFSEEELASQGSLELDMVEGVFHAAHVPSNRRVLGSPDIFGANESGAGVYSGASNGFGIFVTVVAWVCAVPPNRREPAVH